MSGPLGELQPAADGSAADWVFSSLHTFDDFDVGLVIPPGFDAYVCLLHSEQAYDNDVLGSPRLEDTRSLAELLRSATSTSDQCWFCIWSGWGWLHVSAGSVASLGGERPRWRDPYVEVEQFAASAPLVGNEAREYHLFCGPIDAVVDSRPPQDFYQAPSLWWPDDRSWIVASEIDHWWTYVGGTTPVIDRVVDAWRFEARRVAPTDPLDWNELLRRG
jgi:hypothetical protein